MPMEAAFPALLGETIGRMLLQPLARAGAAEKQIRTLPPPPPPYTPKLAVNPSGAVGSQMPVVPSAKKKVKKDKVKVPEGMQGTTRDDEGNPICFAYNSKDRGCNNDSCTRKHVCMVCKKPYPLFKCGKGPKK